MLQDIYHNRLDAEAHMGMELCIQLHNKENCKRQNNATLLTVFLVMDDTAFFFT
jgi:hypothetical protein